MANHHQKLFVVASHQPSKTVIFVRLAEPNKPPFDECPLAAEDLVYTIAVISIGAFAVTVIRAPMSISHALPTN